jgi:hypothetical protein
MRMHAAALVVALRDADGVGLIQDGALKLVKHGVRVER